MRHLYLVSYDISDDKRLRHTYQCMRGYGQPLQYSVFCCDLTRRQRVMLEADLLDIINQKEDRILICRLGPTNDTTRERLYTLGKALPLRGRGPVVI